MHESDDEGTSAVDVPSFDDEDDDADDCTHRYTRIHHYHAVAHCHTLSSPEEGAGSQFDC